MEKTIRICDGIGCQKQEEIGNHWFTVGRLDYDNYPFILTISRRPFEGLQIIVEQRDYCGEECLIRDVSVWAAGATRDFESAVNENPTTSG